MVSHHFSAVRRIDAIIIVAVGCAFLLMAGQAVARSAFADENVTDKFQSYLGSYLAGRLARGLNDTRNAVVFYRRAQVSDPKNRRIVERAFLMELTEGNVREARALARKLVAFNKTHRLAQLWLGVTAFREGRFQIADGHFKLAGSGPIGELTSALARAWTAMARRRGPAALKHLEFRRQAEWAKFYLNYHEAMIADIAGQKALARQSYKTLFEADPRTPRTTMATTRHAASRGDLSLALEVLSRNIANSGGQAHPSVEVLRLKIVAGERLGMLIATPRDGLAEVFYGLGDALTTEGGLSLGMIYLQMALYLKPDFPFALAALANVYEATKQYNRAISTYDRISASTPLKPLVEVRRAANLNALNQSAAAEAVLKQLLVDVAGRATGSQNVASNDGRARLKALRDVRLTGRVLRSGMRGKDVAALQVALQLLGFEISERDGKFGPAVSLAVGAFQRQAKVRADGVVGGETRRLLQAALAAAVEREEARLAIARLSVGLSSVQNGTVRKVNEALANMMRLRKRYPEAIKYYSKIIATLPNPTKRHWTYWYARGTSYERSKDWANAERDLLKALELNPDQPLILNYLGYSWVDQNRNLERGLELISRAVRLKPDDGYVVDSLGWAYYRLGRYKKAAKHLERAVELRPDDPILNDHLGDSLWRVGRKREARYQWELVLTLKPEKKAEEKIRRKLLVGLPDAEDKRAIGLPRLLKKKPKAWSRRADKAPQPAGSLAPQ